MNSIVSRCYYVTAVTSFNEFKAAKNALYSSVLVHEREIATISSFVSKRMFVPAMSWAYLKLGNLASKAIFLVSSDMGKRLYEGWTDPLSTGCIVAICRKLQHISEPIASLTPSKWPILRPITQSFIGLARLIDSFLKDTGAFFDIPNRISTLLSKRVYEAFILKEQSLLERIGGIFAFVAFSFIWVICKIIDLYFKLAQGIICKLPFIERVIDVSPEQLLKREVLVSGFFESQIRKTEKGIRKRAVSELATSALTTTGHIVSSNVFRYLIVHAMADSLCRVGLPKLLDSLAPIPSYGLFDYDLDAYDPIYNFNLKNRVSTFVEYFIAEELLRVYVCFRIYSLYVFLREFSSNVDGQYKARNHTLVYKKNLIKGFLNLKKVKKIVFDKLGVVKSNKSN